MSKQVARVDILIDAAVEHIAAVGDILQVIANGEVPTKAQYADIKALETATTSLNELVKRRHVKPLATTKVKTYKHVKLTPDEIIDYVNNIKSTKSKL
ncbi:Hypothetical protein FSTVST1_185 [Faustovirus ST1]|nr:Hypothetical protein FSTVST1_185 [Faustovirus ST1]